MPDFRQLAEALPQLVWACGPDGRLEWVNARWTRLTGLDAAQTAAGGWRAFVHPEDVPRLESAWADALARGALCEFEYRVREGGGHRWHLCRVAPVKGPDGAVTAWWASATDVHDLKLAEAARRAADHRFQVAYHANPQPTAITRVADGRYLDVNPAFLRVTGYTREQLVGRTVVEVGALTPAEREALAAPLKAGADALEGVEIPFRLPDGRTLRLVINSARIDLDGEDCVLSVVNDVTGRRAAEAALRASEAEARARAEELQAVLDALPAAVWIARDPACAEVHGNRVGNALLRMPPGSNLSKSAADPAPAAHFSVRVGGAEVPASALPLQRAAAEGVEVRDVEEEVRFADGQSLHLLGSAVPLRDPAGRARGAVAAFVDVTRLKQAEAALREADRRKDEFLAILSHELRNPLAPILTAVQLLKLRGAASFGRELEVIERQAQHAVRLVEDLLDVARVARGKVELRREPLELARAVARAVEAAGPALEGRRHSLAVEVAPEGLLVEGDEVRLAQVFANLLTNAARYTPPGGRVRVSAAREGGQVVARVRDTGAGIAPELLPHLFEMFVQGPRRPDRADGGLGLGLSLVRSLTALHGGTVEAHSEGPDRGSEFVVRLPAAGPPPAKAPGPAPAPAPRAGPGRRVLVVDDNADAATLLAMVLEEAGHAVQVAHDPPAALAAAPGFRPEVAILDLGLPVMDGYELAARLRAGPGAPRTLIALTGYGQERDRGTSRAAGFAAHLVKPVDVQQLLDLLAGL